MPNWGRLVAQGRAKAHGIPWNEQEQTALQLGIPADFVRDGALTLEDYEKAKAKDAQDGVPLHRQSKDDVVKQAKEAGVEFTPDASKEALATEVAKKKKGGKNK